MKKNNSSIFLWLFIAYCLHPLTNCFSQDTFSICAVDTITGEVGSAGASCLDDVGCGGCGGVVIISDVHPGVGVIHSQAAYLAANQNYAKSLMNLKTLSPSQIRDSLLTHDTQNNSAVRQYGIVDLKNGSARVAAFTGGSCMDYKNHIVGPNYSIQGNILLGQQILDSMEAGFLNTPGDLACKLMGAMQGAKVIGADTRCAPSGNSSLSSFLRVARPTDTMPNIYLNIVIKKGPAHYEPIDSLQERFDLLHSCPTRVNELQALGLKLQVFPNPAREEIRFVFQENAPGQFQVEIFNSLGQEVLSQELRNSFRTINISSLSTGLYFYKVIAKDGRGVSGKLIKD